MNRVNENEHEEIIAFALVRTDIVGVWWIRDRLWLCPAGVITARVTAAFAIGCDGERQ
jgi:hypothetical protein